MRKVPSISGYAGYGTHQFSYFCIASLQIIKMAL